MIYLARKTLRETHRERMKLDATGAILATLGCTAAVFGFSMGPEKGWLSPLTVGSGVAALVVPDRVRSTSSAPPTTPSCRSTSSRTATGWRRSRRSSWPAA